MNLCYRSIKTSKKLITFQITTQSIKEYKSMHVNTKQHTYAKALAGSTFMRKLTYFFRYSFSASEKKVSM